MTEIFFIRAELDFPRNDTEIPVEKFFSNLKHTPFIEPQLTVIDDYVYILRTGLATNADDSENTRRGILSRALAILSGVINVTMEEKVSIRMWVNNTKRYG